MKGSSQTLLRSSVLLALGFCLAAPTVGHGQMDPIQAIVDPDQFAWRLFAGINQPANDGTNNVTWENWASDADTFPLTPDRTKPPVWPKVGLPKKLRRPVQQMLLAAPLENPHPMIAPVGGNEEVRRNRPTFDFIVKNNLYYQEGLAQAFLDGKPVAVPPESIEIKAIWKPIDASLKPKYHWNVDQDKKLFGLAALHITSKILPNWFWATFEHVDNPRRGQLLGAKDSFGTTPPNSVMAVPSDNLKKLFASANMGSQWLNYRLVASQTDFTDPTGRPTIIGSSEIEQGFETSSSCMTCHARAAADAKGKMLSVFKSRKPPLGFVGAPDPSWFFDDKGKATHIQLDFIWGFVLAQPTSPVAPAGVKHAGMNDQGPLNGYKPEIFPSRIQARLFLERQRLSHAAIPSTDPKINVSKFFIERYKRWSPGATVTVAFSGGNDALYTKIESAANEWTKHGNVKLDFKTAAGTYRTWSSSDTTYQAMIRIYFNDPQGGYWSAVGRNSANVNIIPPGEASMNFDGFDFSLPADYATTVMHEFGHALGFEHEHQSPLSGCDAEFRWFDDANGSGLYSMMAAQGWPPGMVDFNMKQMPNSSAFMLGSYDRLSIMHYHFPEQFFVHGAASPCFVPRNLVLSAGDIAGIKQAYPHNVADIQAIHAHNLLHLEAILKSDNIKGPTRATIERRIDALKNQ